MKVGDASRQRGFTDSHYKALKRMQDILGFEYRFQVLAFPCNQFGEQEPSTNYDIKNFVYRNYRVESPVFSKIDVIGDKSHPAFRNLVASRLEAFINEKEKKKREKQSNPK
ncbi:glutathione peroxidase 7-like [Artemia franciscana]|uniref:glutathione peroxidase 7-like n=1 Tax=Artemia franciscana TaxID=6661 RepID=UPI0032D9C949